METLDYIPIIEQAFVDMQQRKEEIVIVRFFENIEQIRLPSEGIIQANFVKIIMQIIEVEEASVCVIKLLYGPNDHHKPLLFMTDEEKLTAVKILRYNGIMPTPEEWKQARSLLNSMSCETVDSMFHGDNNPIEFPTEELKNPAYGYNVP